MPLRAEIKLEVWDSPNSAGVVIDAVRLAKIGLDRRLERHTGRAVGVSNEVAAAQQITDEKARELLEEFIVGSGDEVGHVLQGAD